MAYVGKERGLDILVVKDGAPPHQWKAAQYARNQHSIHQLPHPPNSPDLNPIEPVWFLLKKRISEMPKSRNSLDELWKAVRLAWDTITVKDINKHTGKMDARVLAVLGAKGLHTRF